MNQLYRRCLPYGVAIATTTTALLLTLWLQRFLAQTAGSLFYVAVIITTGYGGMRPGLLATVLSLIAINYYFTPPLKQGFDLGDLVRLMVFVTVSVVLNLLSSNLRQRVRQVEQLSQQLQTASTERLNTALQAAKMGLWDWDLATGEIRWSPEHEQLFGLAPGHFDGRYETFNARVYPDDLAGVEQAIATALQNRIPYQHEYRIIWPDGSIHWVEGRGKALYNPQGQAMRMTGTIMAIDEQKQAQQLIEQQYEQQRLITEMTQRIRQSLHFAHILQTTVNEVQAYLNADRVIIFEFDQNWGSRVTFEAVADPKFAILPLEIYDPCVGEEYLESLKQGFVTAQADIDQADISPCYVEFLAQLQVRANLVVPILKDERLWGLLVAHHCTAPRQWQDFEIALLRQLASQVSITLQQADLWEQLQTELAERIQAEQALRQREEIFQLLLKYVPVGITMFDRDMCYLAASQHFIDELQLPSQEVILGRSHDEVFPEFAATLKQAYHGALAGNIVKCYEYCFQYQGTQKWYRWEARPWYQINGDIGGIIIFSEEITQRKQAELSLANSEARLRLAQSASQSGVWDWDITTNTLFWSPEYYQLYQLEKDVEPTYENWLASIYPEDREPTHQYMTDILKQDVLFFSLEFRGFSWNTLRWFTAIGQIFRNEDGVATRMIGITLDITDRKQAELALVQAKAELEQRVEERTQELQEANTKLQATLVAQQESQAQLLEQAQLLDLAHDTIMTYDLNRVITFWNRGAERMYGWSPSEALGKMTDHLLQTQFPQPLAEIEALLFEQGYWEGELVHIRKDNRPITVASRWVLQKDQQRRPQKVLEINNDITGRKEAEALVRNYILEVEDLYNRAPCGYHSLDANGTIIRINDTELDWLGYSREEVIDKMKITDFIAPGKESIFEQNFLEFKQQGYLNDLELPLLCKDGRLLWMSVNSTAMYDDAGNFVMSRSTLFDITERRKIDRMKQEFISMVSHELRTPLTSIRGSLGLLAGGVYDRKPEKMKAMIAIAARQSERLVRLVNDILDLRRLEAGQTQFHFQAQDAAALIQQAVDAMRSQAETSQITLVSQSRSLSVWADADAIMQTLINLISNAIKFSPPNTTITVSATVAPTDIPPTDIPPTDIPPSDIPPAVRFAIQDQGRGIPADHLESIFGQFQQVDASDSREKGGTGLGLAICRAIVEQHQGKIWAESILGQGSTFYVTLPAPPP